MTTLINENRIEGTEMRMVQFLHGSPDCNKFQVNINMDGVDVNLLTKHAIDAGLIVLRKRIKTKEQAQALAEGVTFSQLVSAVVQDSSTMAASINLDELSPKELASLQARAQASLDKQAA